MALLRDLMVLILREMSPPFRLPKYPTAHFPVSKQFVCFISIRTQEKQRKR